MNIEQEILSLFAEEAGISDIGNNLINQEIKDIGINSITFVKIIVTIENKYNIEFDFDMLSINQFSTLASLIVYVRSKL